MKDNNTKQNFSTHTVVQKPQTNVRRIAVLITYHHDSFQIFLSLR